MDWVRVGCCRDGTLVAQLTKALDTLDHNLYLEHNVFLDNNLYPTVICVNESSTRAIAHPDNIAEASLDS